MNGNILFFIFVVPIVIADQIIDFLMNKHGINSNKTLIGKSIIFAVAVSVALKLVSHFDGSGHEFAISETIGMAVFLFLVECLYTFSIRKAQTRRNRSIRK